jgi:hypothetical protein
MDGAMTTKQAINPLGLYGEPEMMRINANPRIKYLTEFESALHMYNPSDPRFVPAPISKQKKVVPPSMRPDVAWCTGCRDWHSVECFHRNSSRPNGLQHYCIDARAARRKVGSASENKDVKWNWYRAKK